MDGRLGERSLRLSPGDREDGLSEPGAGLGIGGIATRSLNAMISWPCCKEGEPAPRRLSESDLKPVC